MRSLCLNAATAGAVVAALCLAGLAVESTAGAAVVSSNPSGHLDGVTVAGTRATVGGWAADSSSSAAIRIVVVRDGAPVATVLAASRRADVARAFPRFGALHGFSASVTVPAGTHSLCVNAINVGAGGSSALGCRVVTVGGTPVKAAPPAATSAPFGSVDRATYSAGKLTVSGWTIDPDTAASTLVDVSVGSVRLASVAANRARPDVAKVYPRFGTAHGYSATVALAKAPGNYLACVSAVNTGAGATTKLPCRMFSVVPAGVPADLHTDTASAAASALQTQAIRSGAAKSTEFPSGASAAARIAVATRALLEQATGKRTAPRAVSGLPKFTVAASGRPVDEQVVMGPTPNMGSHASAPGGRTGATRSVETFRNDPRPTPSGAGDGLLTAAPVLPANGTTVHPRLPAYRAGTVKVRAEVAIDAALTQLGVPYVFAGAGPSSFDCSGLTMWAYAKAGIDLYHYTGTQARQGVRVQRNQLLPGDLLLFGSDVHHVGMYLGAGYMIDAPYTGVWVRIDKISSGSDFSLAVRP